MKLEELHVGDRAARAIRHRNPVARRDVGVCRVAIDLARTTGGEHNDTGTKDLDFSCLFVEHVGAEATVVDAAIAQATTRDQVDRVVVLKKRDLRMRRRRLHQRLGDRATRGVFGVHDATRGVTTFTGEVELGGVVGAARELHTALHQFLQARRSLFDTDANSFGIVETVAGDDRVFDVRGEAVVFVDDDRDAALRPARIAIEAVTLGDNRDATVLGELESGGESGGAGAENEDIKDVHGRLGAEESDARR